MKFGHTSGHFSIILLISCVDSLVRASEAMCEVFRHFKREFLRGYGVILNHRVVLITNVQTIQYSNNTNLTIIVFNRRAVLEPNNKSLNVRSSS